MKAKNVLPKADNVSLMAENMLPEKENMLPKAENQLPDAENELHKAENQLPDAENQFLRTENVLSKTYEPASVEERLYTNWMERGYFHAKPNNGKKPYTIVIPPPNITGQLHMGHALDNTMQDILIRWKRMEGYEALWLPGTDHASIATEVKIVEAMAKEGLTKAGIGRKKFLERAWEWRRVYGSKIVEQLKKLGSSCDWQRERFTMDEGLSEAVREVFVRLYNKGLIYRGERMINWCPRCSTSISDAEVEYEEDEGKLYYIDYPLQDGSGSIRVATTRPETMLGDTAVAVNPADERYAAMIGKMTVLPLLNKLIPIITDDYVEKDFGTGAVKITPAHDPNDFEVGQRHNLPLVKVMNDDATMNTNAGIYAGLDRYDARKRILADLEAQGLLAKTEKYIRNLGSCYRCNTVIEPTVSLQWFVKMKPLAEPAIKAVKDGTVHFVPERFAKIYYNWMENVKDWCISRQLWWGHRIPAFYCQDCGEMVIVNSTTPPEKCPICGGAKLIQDPDTLDTWFSSALWPFSTLGWPQNTEDFQYFYPTSVLVTAYDIIFFWVARMIFSGLEHTGREPFKYVFIHGLVRDAEGRKMSKSLGNGIDPLEVIEKFGTDALRFALCIGNSPGNDLRFSLEKVEACRNFANKVWNAARFVLMNIDNEKDAGFETKGPELLSFTDKWILSRINSLSSEVTENMEKFELGIALQKIYEFIWEEFCDWYIEFAKPGLYDRQNPGRPAVLYTLTHVLAESMKLLHPFMPFITEEIYQHLPQSSLFNTCGHTEEIYQHLPQSSLFNTCGHTGDDCGCSFTISDNTSNNSIMISSWPRFDVALASPFDEAKVAVLIEAIKGIRNIRTEMGVPPSKKAAVWIISPDENTRILLSSSAGFFERLSSVSKLTILADKEEAKGLNGKDKGEDKGEGEDKGDDEGDIAANAMTAILPGMEIYIPLGELIDIAKEKERLEKEKANLENELARAEGKLNNQGFLSKAPPAVIADEQAKKEKYQELYKKVLERIHALKM